MTNNLRDQLQATLSGSYTIERELGGGGMSRVFLAEETQLSRKVVVKVLSTELAAEISAERFQREIKTAASLQQANIVPVLTAGNAGGVPYFTMPFVEGESLRARLGRTGALSITEAVKVMGDIARALAYAHERGIVHRDIKPDNVLLSGGTAVVTDFGIAKAITAARTGGGGQSPTLTQLGTALGTPAYMAPEQAAGDPSTDHRADFYAFGCTAYELLTGRPPFVDKTPQRLLAAHMSLTPDAISTLRMDIPRPLADLVMRCLEKEAPKRPATANEIIASLDAVSTASGGSHLAMPGVLLGGPAMFRKALAIYAGAFVAVAILAKAAIVGIGLPDWVFPGSLVVMALGLPIVLWTGYVQRVVRRAATATPTYTPGGTSAVQHGTMATMALKAAPHVSWYKTARGGMYAFGVFIVMIGAFMGMRAFGIGPFGSLIATGAFAARDRVIITDFTVSNGDSALGRVVSDAVRAGLADSRVFTIMTPAEIASALQRMQQAATARVDLGLARQMALREGAKAIVDGDVTIVGTSYIVAARLVTADSARELASFRGTASGSDAIIDVADDLARKLRAKTGESLRKVQATPPLAYASTSSLEALRKYSEGARASDVERDGAKAVRLLREAVALDSNFAEAWRKLGAALTAWGGLPPSVADSATRRAYALRDRMTERERDAIVAFYYWGSPGFDRAKSIETYERMLARGDSAVGINNLAQLYSSRRDYARAEELFRAGLAGPGASQIFLSNFLATLARQAKMGAFDSVLTLGRALYPGSSTFDQLAIQRSRFEGHLDDTRKALDSALKAGDRRTPSWATNELSQLAAQTGRLREAAAYRKRAREIDSVAGRPRPAVFVAMADLQAAANAGLPLGAEIKAFDAVFSKFTIDELPVSDRPYLALAETNARAGRVDQARALLSRHDAAVRDTALRRSRTPVVQQSQATIAVAERRWADAVAMTRSSDRVADGPATNCDDCLPRTLIRIFAEAGQPDSALAAYAEYRRTPMGSRPRQGPDVVLGAPLLEQLARIYDSRGDVDNAVLHYREFVELWKNADPELQPRVKAARERLAKLTPVERPR